MKAFFALAVAAFALVACGSTPTSSLTTTPPPAASSQVTDGQALYGAILGADTAVKTLATGGVPLGASACAAFKQDAPIAVGAFGLASTAYAASDLTTTEQELAAASAVTPILTALAAAPASTPSAAAPAKPTTAQEIAAAVAAALSAAEDLSQVQQANTVPALQAAIPPAVSALQADVDNFSC